MKLKLGDRIRHTTELGTPMISCSPTFFLSFKLKHDSIRLFSSQEQLFLSNLLKFEILFSRAANFHCFAIFENGIVLEKRVF